MRCLASSRWDCSLSFSWSKYRLHVAWAHFIEGRLASDCDVEQGVTAISCADVSLTFTVLSSSCADAVALINADLRSQDEDEVARVFVNTTDVSEEVRDAFLTFLDLYPLVGMDAHPVTKKKEGLQFDEQLEMELGQQQHAKQAELLGVDREHEIGGVLRQEIEMGLRALPPDLAREPAGADREIGRASCRERV